MVLAASLTPPHPASPLFTVRQIEFSPFGWRLGFIWEQRESHSGAVRREVKEGSVADAGGERDRTGNQGFDLFAHQLGFVRASGEPWRCSLLFGCSYCASF